MSSSKSGVPVGHRDILFVLIILTCASESRVFAELYHI